MPPSPPSRRSKWDDDDGPGPASSSRSSRPDRRGDEGRSRREEYRHDRGYEDRGASSRRSGRGDEKDRYRGSNGRAKNVSHGYKRRSRSRSPRPSSSSARPDFAADRARERRAYESSARSRDFPSGSREGRRGPPSEEPLAIEEEAVSFEPSGLLAKESNQKDGVALKYHEPPEARKPRLKWRLYVFKNGKEEELLHISRQSCYLLGRDRTVVDIPLDHASCSKQHAAIQFRQVTERNEFGDEKRSIRPFLIDLDSANGSYVNKDEIPTSRFYELKNGDTMAFGASEREYVLLCEDE